MDKSLCTKRLSRRAFLVGVIYWEMKIWEPISEH